MVLGFDSSTQSLSAVLLGREERRVLASVSVNFGEELPEYGQESGFISGGSDGEVHSDPMMWLDALDRVLDKLRDGGVDLAQVEAVSGSGQQHGSVYLNERFEEVVGDLDEGDSLSGQLRGCLSRATAPIWMDTSTGEECAEIAEAVGGDAEVCRRSGSVAIERFTGPQIRKFFKREPEAYAETARIHLVSSFLASVLAGKSVGIDRGDGAGMNLMNLAEGDWDEGLLEATGPGLREKLPEVVDSGEVVGEVGSYFVGKYGFSRSCRVVAWSGDNPCSLVGMGAARPGKVVISLGTSDTLFAAMPEAVTDPRGYGHVFGNPMGGFMSLICFRNGSLAREAVKERYGLGWEDFEVDGLARTPAGNGGRVVLPFVDDEITPRVASKGLVGVGWEGEPTANEMVRGILEGQFLNMKRHSDWLGVETEEILMTGGASENDGIAQVAADVFGKRVRRLEVAGSAALGAAVRAAVALGDDLEAWEAAVSSPAAGRDVEPRRENAAIYAELEKTFAEALKNHFKLT